MEPKRTYDYCIAIIGNPNQRVLNVFFSSNSQPLKIHEVSFVEAKTRLEWTSWLRSLGNNQLGIGAGSAGCLLAHRDAWATFEICSHDFLLVLEDDAVLTKYGRKYLSEIILKFKDTNLQLMHLGDHIRYSPLYLLKFLATLNIREILRVIYENHILKAFKPKVSHNRFPFSGHAYLINSEIARVLLNNPVQFLYPVDVHLNSISQVSRNNVAKIRTPIFVQANNRPSFIKQRGR